MSIFDAIKKSVLEGFDTSITTADIFLGLIVSLLAGIYILLIYKQIQKEAGIGKNYALTLLLITSISAMIVLTITSNLALSLGMVGALSIVRFRTAIKDASDTAFLFWAVAAGITAGAGFYFITLIGCLFIGVVCVVGAHVLSNCARTYLLVVRASSIASAEPVEKLLKQSKLQFKLSAMTESGDHTEIIYELTFSGEYKNVFGKIREIPGITSISLVDCRKS